MVLLFQPNFVLPDGRIDTAAAEREARRLRAEALRDGLVGFSHWISARFGQLRHKSAPAQGV